MRRSWINLALPIGLPIGLLAGLQTAAAGEPCCPAPEGLRIAGFVDASYLGNLQQRGDSFRLDQVELDLEHHAADGLVLRADLQTDGDGELAVEQGFVKLPLPLVPAYALSVGKFNAPMGVELLDAPDMFQFSHSLLFDFGLPTNLTGALLEGPLAGPVDLKLFVVNGWDVNNDTNASRSFGGRVGADLGLWGALGASFISGREDGVKTGGPEDLQVFDLDYLIRPRDNLCLFAELNLGSVKPVGGSSLAWSGALLGGHYDFTPVWGATLRYDWLTDDDGVLFGPVGTENQTRSSLTAALTAAAAPGRTVLLEVRLDGSDQDAFQDADDAPASSTLGLALEFTQTF
ncbi:MAG: outer membrane beta-barrel protein [Candidatus Delongbacteria bacterium]